MKIFIYDSSKGFSRFLKLKLSGKHDLFICTNKHNIVNYYHYDFDCAFINFNDIDDLHNLFLIFHNVKRIFVSTNLQYIKEMISGTDSIFLLDLEDKKSKILNEINFNLGLINKYS